jgi:hypothetical protein
MMSDLYWQIGGGLVGIAIGAWVMLLGQAIARRRRQSEPERRCCNCGKERGPGDEFTTIRGSRHLLCMPCTLALQQGRIDWFLGRP